MNSFLWKTYFIGYVANTCLKIPKIKRMKKKGFVEEAEKYINEKALEWGKNTINKAGIKVNVIGKENIPKGACLFIGNHQSLLDVPVMMGFLDKPMGFIAKKELMKVPGISTWMKQLHCIFMDRENIKESVKSINQGAEYLKDGYSMAIFPEGTRSQGKGLGEFKKGSLKLGTKAGVPIVPVTIDGTYRILEANKGKMIPGTVKITVDKPIIASELTKDEQNNLIVTIRNIIAKNLEENKLF